MKKVLITGASDFLGLNLLESLRRREDTEIRLYDRSAPRENLLQDLIEVDVICHLESVYRTTSEIEYLEVNAGLTRWMVEVLTKAGRSPRIILLSSTQVEGEGAYGRSKRLAEDALMAYAERSGALVSIFRLPNEFGKWCRPDHNSVVATFCHRLAHGMDIAVIDPERVLTLAYVDDIVALMLKTMNGMGETTGARFIPVEPTYVLTVGDLAEKLRGFPESRRSLVIPDFSDRLMRCLYATYLSYLEGTNFTYALDKRIDTRGVLAEFFKSPYFGQVFVSRTRPGVTRGNHCHDSKVEKFCVLEGDAIIRLRHMVSEELFIHRVRGEEFKVVDIPPGYSHSIENAGHSEMIVLFWANETFDPDAPDTHTSEVLHA